jgi:transposase
MANDTSETSGDATKIPAATTPATMILALDLGKFKSVACLYDPADGTHAFETLPTSPADVRQLLAARKPARLVIEACAIAGWVADLARELSVPIQVANANTDAWQWRRVKRKTDRDDALKLAKLSAMDQLPTVHTPEPAVRQWKSLIKYRHALIDRRTGVKNTVRSLLDSQGLGWPARAKGWTAMALKELATLARPIADCDALNLWRGQLHLELQMLESVTKLIAEADQKLDALGARDANVTRLKTIPGVGPRLAELVVSTLDDPKRFATGRQVGAYAGLVPKQYQSGVMDRKGRITGHGPGLLRRVLVQVAWGMQRRATRGKAVFEGLCHGQRTRRKQAVVALARKILVWCWAILRDGGIWVEDHRPPKARAGPNPALTPVPA